MRCCVDLNPFVRCVALGGIVRVRCPVVARLPNGWQKEGAGQWEADDDDGGGGGGGGVAAAAAGQPVGLI